MSHDLKCDRGCDGPVRAWNEGSEAALYRQRPYCLSGARYSDTTKTQSLARLGLRFSSHRLSQSERDLSRPELIEPHKGDKRYVRRDAHGQFRESDDSAARSRRISGSMPKKKRSTDRATKATAPSSIDDRLRRLLNGRRRNSRSSGPYQPVRRDHIGRGTTGCAAAMVAAELRRVHGAQFGGCTGHGLAILGADFARHACIAKAFVVAMACPRLNRLH